MTTDARQFYAVLGLDPSCSDEDIRSAFRRLAKALHPDTESGDAAAFIRLKRAYDTLGDPALRALYDRARNARERRTMRAAFDPPIPPRPRPHRSGGMSFARYFVAFLFMGGLSFGAIEMMISYAEDPSAGSSHPASLLAGASSEPTKEGPRAKAATGFWDSSSPDGTPRESGGDGARKRSNGLGAFSSE